LRIEVCQRRRKGGIERQLLIQLAEETFDLLRIVDHRVHHSPGSDSHQRPLHGDGAAGTCNRMVREGCVE
jgi:hypothetical protein